MPSSAHGYQRPVLLRAVRNLIREARSERSTLPIDSPERHFHLGVEAAAMEVLHPEITDARAPEWLDQETPAFREGYRRTAGMLASAMTAAEAPLRLRLPDATLH